MQLEAVLVGDGSFNPTIAAIVAVGRSN